MAAANSVKEALWLLKLACAFELKHNTLEMVRDNQATLRDPHGPPGISEIHTCQYT